jgi:Staphylococcal nuclease homologue
MLHINVNIALFCQLEVVLRIFFYGKIEKAIYSALVRQKLLATCNIVLPKKIVSNTAYEKKLVILLRPEIFSFLTNTKLSQETQCRRARFEPPRARYATILVKNVSESRYGRLLRFVFVDTVMVNYELVREGYARATPYPSDTSC